MLQVMEGAGDEGGVECDCPAIVGAFYEELGGAWALGDGDVAQGNVVECAKVVYEVFKALGLAYGGELCGL